MKTTIRDFYGKIIGHIEEMPNGDKKVTDFYGRVLGWYKKSINATTDFYGRIIARGDACGMLIR
ncbi:MAG: hypothetical protein IIX01_06050 [Clostridia bacterium]|nr:hypothetical protein [Clostridia bacterium]